MKDKFKKITLTALFATALFILPFSIKDGIAKVSAACHPHTNYYFYGLVAGYNSYLNEEFPYERQHASYFSDELPEGAKIDTVQYKWIDLGKGEDGWTFRKFWEQEITVNTTDLNDGGAPNPKKNGDEWYFAHAKAWIDNADGTTREDFVDHTIYPTDTLVETTYYAQADNGFPTLVLQDSANNLIAGGIKRYIGSDWVDFAKKVSELKDSSGKHPTSGQIWIPALYAATFQVCEEEPDPEPEPEPTPEYNVIVKYVDDETNEEIKNQKDLGNFKTGEDYSAVCDDTIGEYELVSEKQLGGTMANSDVVLYCRYKQPEVEPAPTPTFDLTINYLDKNTREPIKDPYHDPNAYETGDKYTAECLDAIGNTYILDSFTGSLSGTFADRDIVINCLYTTQPVQTSDIPIYIVWAVGGAGLIYSIYYFRKYYKKQSSV